MADEVVTGALVRDGRVLLVHRRVGRLHFPDCWDLPGGHVEPGEQPSDALVRELQEELGVRAVVSGSPVLRIEYEADTDDGAVLAVWVIRRWRGEPMNAAEDEHDELRWVSLRELDRLHISLPASVRFLRDLLRGEPAVD